MWSWVVSVVTAVSSGLEQTVDGRRGLGDLRTGVATARDAVGHAVTDVVVQETHGHLAQTRLRRRDLGQDVDAVLVRVHHPLQTADLALDLPEPDEQIVL